MSIARTRHRIRPVKSTNRYGRSNKRHFARQNHRKRTSAQFEKKFRNVVLSQFKADSWIPCPSGYTRGQGWNCLFRAWLGYKISGNPKNGESFQDRLRWAVTIQNIQTDLGLQRTAFPTLGIEGDYVFTYTISKQMELEDLDNELWLEEFKKKRRAHIQDIVDASMLSEQEKEWMEEYASQSITDTTYDNENRYIERLVLPNLFDMRRNSLHSNV